ncbi:response regulator [Phormidium sp. LEGE 05292]|uniref:sensor histidine kinase n=1 Tax=[Phormidium] sp. LEGE 05292 TaxID=767427 RepID=UPI0018823170|nr:response regulator [Phormidium sp. LEGE 05292]MBE9223868.1 response regulator [Phormidium sp. LEGE 05292]
MNPDLKKNYKANILVVDDTPANLRLLVGMLTENGYKVRPVMDGELALTGAKAIPPDLILLDINMPKMNGYEVCEKLKENELTREIPVIFISALDDVLDKVKAFQVGGVDYVTKPFQVEEVLMRVETHLAIRQLEKNLITKNQDLEMTVQQLQNTQEQLIQSEKMAALGQLVAGIAHEINTPLGAIRSSVENIADFLKENLLQFPDFFNSLMPEYQQYFWEILHRSSEQKNSLSSKEKRQLKKSLIKELEAKEISNADTIADTLVDLGIYDRISSLVPLFQDEKGSQILEKAYQIASIQKSTDTIRTATEKAAKVVFALKNYARYDHTGEKVRSQIPEGIDTVLTLYNNQLKHGIEVTKDYEPNLPSLLCYPDELNQVWTNLIHNAIQAMDYKGHLAINITHQGDSLLVSITDSGKGIPPDIMPRIFEPFFTTKPPGEGSGLGLDIVQKIIQKHDGKIFAESVPGKTTFNVNLPLNPNS